jgi:hypothetical protein
VGTTNTVPPPRPMPTKIARVRDVADMRRSAEKKGWSIRILGYASDSAICELINKVIAIRNRILSNCAAIVSGNFLTMLSAAPLTLGTPTQTAPNTASMVIGTYHGSPLSLDSSSGFGRALALRVTSSGGTFSLTVAADLVEGSYAPQFSDYAPPVDGSAGCLERTVPAARITSTLALTTKRSADFRPAPVSPTRRTGPAIRSA